MQAGSWAEWFAATGTIAAVVVALYVAIRDQKTSIRAQKRHQADSISVWLVQFGDSNNNSDKVYISNSSHQPVHEVFVSYGVAYGAGAPYLKSNENQVAALRVPPGDYMIRAPKYPGKGMHVELGLSVSFRDIRGVYWRRDATGSLTEIKRSNFQELDIHEPFSSWELLDPITPIPLHK